MNAEAPIAADIKPRWRRRLSVAVKRSRFIPLIELATLAALIVMLTVSYFIIAEQSEPNSFLTPPLVAALLAAADL